jgi:hypothetical protein
MRHKRFSARMLLSVTFYVFTFYVCPFYALAGCTSSQNGQPTTRPSGGYDRQERAIKDPFGYSPDVRNSDSTGSKSGLGEFDREGLRKDLDHVFNP